MRQRCMEGSMMVAASLNIHVLPEGTQGVGDTLLIQVDHAM